MDSNTEKYFIDRLERQMNSILQLIANISYGADNTKLWHTIGGIEAATTVGLEYLNNFKAAFATSDANEDLSTDESTMDLEV